MIADFDIEILDEDGIVVNNIGGISTVRNEIETLKTNEEKSYNIDPDYGVFALPLWNSDFKFTMNNVIVVNITGSVVTYKKSSNYHDIGLIIGAY